MSDDREALVTRKAALSADLDKEAKRYFAHARWNYSAAQVLSWGSLLASVAAALFGIIPTSMPKWGVGVLAALSTTLIAASRQLGFQQKANWHYRKADQLKALKRRLDYELPPSPTPDNLATISSSWSAIDISMTKEWEDMQHETPTKPPA